MAKSQLPSPELLRKLLDYDPDTGLLIWKTRVVEFFSGCKCPGRAVKAWNAKYAGTPALACPNEDGYLTGTLLAMHVKAHSVIWAMQTGEWPSDEIDHRNGKRDDNSWLNLRETTKVMNQRNKRRYLNNKSGHTGVYWHGLCGRWAAQIRIDGKASHLGMFETIEEAVAARQAAEIGHGFTARHGQPLQT